MLCPRTEGEIPFVSGKGRAKTATTRNSKSDYTRLKQYDLKQSEGMPAWSRPQASGMPDA